MQAITFDGYPMTTDNPVGLVWIQDITSLEPGAMPWVCYPFGDPTYAELVVQMARALTFAECTDIYDPLPAWATL